LVQIVLESPIGGFSFANKTLRPFPQCYGTGHQRGFK
jgi:hypothetical protein